MALGCFISCSTMHHTCNFPRSAWLFVHTQILNVTFHDASHRTHVQLSSDTVSNQDTSHYITQCITQNTCLQCLNNTLIYTQNTHEQSQSFDNSDRHVQLTISRRVCCWRWQDSTSPKTPSADLAIFKLQVPMRSSSSEIMDWIW